MLVHCPIVFWTCAAAADVIGFTTGGALAAKVAFDTLALGCAAGFLTMIAGFIDFADLPKDSPARDTAVTHVMTTCGAWLVFLLALALHGFPPKAPVSIAALLATGTGFLTMVFGAWQGGRLVYEFGIGSHGRSGADRQ
jgi:uncharacterized membrane protein